MRESQYRVVIDNSQDQWLYQVRAASETDAVARAKVLAEADGWNGRDLGVTVEVLS